jgi:hypothetical protein
MHRLNLVRCGLLLPIRGDALFSAVVPLSREVWNLQKSHAHPYIMVLYPSLRVGKENRKKGKKES